MNLIKCILYDMEGDVSQINKLEILLPAIPPKGDENFDVMHEDIMYNCSIISVDWIIKEQRLSHCAIYIK